MKFQPLPLFLIPRSLKIRLFSRTRRKEIKCSSTPTPSAQFSTTRSPTSSSTSPRLTSETSKNLPSRQMNQEYFRPMNSRQGKFSIYNYQFSINDTLKIQWKLQN